MHQEYVPPHNSFTVRRRFPGKEEHWMVRSRKRFPRNNMNVSGMGRTWKCPLLVSRAEMNVVSKDEKRENVLECLCLQSLKVSAPNNVLDLV